MRFLTLSGIGWLLSLGGLCCWLLIVICALKILLPHVWSNLRLLIPSYAPKLLKFAAGLGFIGLSFFAGHHVGYGAGYGYRDHELISNTRTYFGVSVLSQQSEQEYTVKVPGYVKQYDWKFCHPLKMPSPLIDIKYEQRYGCKVVNGVGFVAPHQEKKDDQLQTGRYSTPASTSTLVRLEKGRP